MSAEPPSSFAASHVSAFECIERQQLLEASVSAFAYQYDIGPSASVPALNTLLVAADAATPLPAAQQVPTMSATATQTPLGTLATLDAERDAPSNAPQAALGVQAGNEVAEHTAFDYPSDTSNARDWSSRPEVKPPYPAFSSIFRLPMLDSLFPFSQIHI